MLAINGMPDHIHIFFGLNPAVSISDLVKDIKRASNNWINAKDLVKGKFEWQTGYGAFSTENHRLRRYVSTIEKKNSIMHNSHSKRSTPAY